MDFRYLAAAILLLAGCADTEGSSGEPILDAPDTLLNSTASHDVVLGLHGVHFMDLGSYASYPILEQPGLSGKCLSVDLDGPVTNVTVEMTWDDTQSTTSTLRLVLAAPELERWVEDIEGTSPMVHSFDAALLEGTSMFALVATLPSGSTAASVAQELELHVDFSWLGDGEPEYSRPGCSVSGSQGS